MIKLWTMEKITSILQLNKGKTEKNWGKKVLDAFFVYNNKVYSFILFYLLVLKFIFPILYFMCCICVYFFQDGRIHVSFVLSLCEEHLNV